MEIIISKLVTSSLKSRPFLRSFLDWKYFSLVRSFHYQFQGDLKIRYALKWGLCMKPSCIELGYEVNSLPMQLWPVAHFFSFCHHFWVGATAKQQQTHPKVITEWKKWATGQSSIRKEVSSYKIHTLAVFIEKVANKPIGWWFESIK